MSLVVWLPLNGNSKNQGTKQYTETINTLEYTDNGKTTNKCMNLGMLQYNKNPLGMVGSICFWIYPKSTDEGSNGKAQLIFGNDNASMSRRKWSLYLYSNQPSITPHSMSLHSWGCQKDGSSTFNGSFTLNGVLKESAWNHICVTHDLNYEYIYINGVLKHKVRWDSNGTFTFDIETHMIYGDYSNYRLNDFRIYDHCLTQSEVSEIAKGLMLHYSFENPYAEPTTNLCNGTYLHQSTSGSDDIGSYFIQKSSNQWNAGLWLKDVKATGGNYYTWSLEVNPNADIYCRFDNNYKNTTYDGNDSGFDIVSRYSKQFIPKNTWTKIWLTIYTHPDSGSGYINHAFCPSMPSGISECKVYYRNSTVEKKNHMTPYTSSSREAGLIRDNSGMGNDGTIVYQREELALTDCISNHYGCTITKSGSSYIINNFTVVDNLNLTLAKIDYNSRYCYLNSLWSFEFDIKLENMTYDDTLTKIIRVQGPIYKKDGSLLLTNNNTWYTGNPIHFTEILTRVKNGTNGTYHITIQKSFTNEETCKASNNIDYYCFGLRFDAVTAGTVTISNLHAYYGSLDTSTLSLSDNSAIGTHSAYFNGKNYINCGLVVPEEMDELTLSCWVYKEDWSTLNPNWSTTGITPSIIGNIDAGGFGLKVENGNNTVNWTTYYKDHNYGQDNLIDCSDFTSGWHLFTGVSTRTKKLLYVDGNIVNSNDITWNTPIHSKDNVANIRRNIYIGTEVNGDYFTNLENAYIDDVRLYSTALSEEDIKALYNVKAKIDNKSNLYCNQLVETKPENMMKPMDEINISNEMHKFASDGTFTCTDGIMKYTISFSTPPSSDPHSGFYFSNSTYGGALKDNLAYRTSFYVRVSKAGTYVMGDERIGLITRTLEAGKWYKIVQEGLAIGKFANLIIYNCSRNLVAGDKIQVRDFQMYRLYDNKNYNPGPNIKGQYKTFELNETFNEDVENSGATIVDKYGAEWLEIFYHNNKSGTILFANEQEALHTNSQYKFSILDQLENFRGTDNKFEFLLEYPDDFPNEYNRWKQTDNPVTVSEVIGGDPYKAAGYESVHIDWDSNKIDSSVCNTFSGLLRSSRSSTYTLIDGSIGHGNWHTAIGAMTSWNGGVPTPMTQPALGRIRLYVRIDNLPNKNEIFRQYKRQTKTKEIIEI